MSIDRFILASGSPRRKELLEQIGINPEIIPSDIDEKVTTSVPGELVISLSKSKAMDIASKLQMSERTEDISFTTGTPVCSEDFSPAASPQDKIILILGADTVVSVDGHILGKPHSHEEAAEMIRSIRGRSHQVYTGVTIIAGDSTGQTAIDSFAVKTDVNVYPMTEEEIRTYSESAEPMDKAGAYGIQGTFARYIKGIEGDYNNVVGLPVAEVYQRIKKYMI